MPAPVVVQGRRGRRLAFHDFPLPEGFDIRDHAARVDVFGRAFVRSVTGDRADYDVAKEYVAGRFGKRN